MVDTAQQIQMEAVEQLFMYNREQLQQHGQLQLAQQAIQVQAVAKAEHWQQTLVGLVIQVVEAVPELLEHLAKEAQELQPVAVELVEHRAQVLLTQVELESTPAEQSHQMVAAAVVDYWQPVRTQQQRPEQLADKAAAAAEQDITRQPEQLAVQAQF